MLSDFLNLIFPRVCLICEVSLQSQEKVICTKCRHQLPVTDNHLEYEYDIAKRLMGRLSCKYILAHLYFRKRGVVQDLIHEFKYRGNIEIGKELGKFYGAALKQAKLNNQFDLIIPIPLHPEKLKKRGFNQSDIFGKYLAEQLGIEYANDIVVRTSNTQTQTRKSRINRWQNVESMFEIVNTEKLANKDVLIVDDILTTGATFEAVGSEILKHNTRTISVLAMAVAV